MRIVIGALIALLLFPAVALGHSHISTDFAVTVTRDAPVHDCRVQLRTIVGEDKNETGEFAVFDGNTVIFRDGYNVKVSQSWSFGVNAGTYLLVWDNEPVTEHSGQQSHREKRIICRARVDPTPFPTPTPPPDSPPSERPDRSDRPERPVFPDITLPPTDTTPESSEAPDPVSGALPAIFAILGGLLILGFSIGMIAVRAKVREWPDR